MAPLETTPTYDRAGYWSDVADRLTDRQADRELAGNAGPFHRYRRTVSLERLFSLLPVTGLSVLELGSGPGGNLRVLSARGPARLVGADISPRMVELARWNTEAEMVQLDGGPLPFADQEFDSTLTHTVLQHNPDRVLAELVSELTRVTRGTLLLIEDTTVLRDRSFGGTYWVRRNDEYIALVTSFGFRLCDVHTADVWLSEKAWLAIRRLMSLTDRGGHEEGAAVTAIEQRLERAALRITRPLDPHFPQLSGKTALRFERLPR